MGAMSICIGAVICLLARRYLAQSGQIPQIQRKFWMTLEQRLLLGITPSGVHFNMNSVHKSASCH
jgi:hypothetical protein